MKTKLSVILLLAMSALAGCGGSSSGSPVAAATTSTAAKVSITSSNQSTITNSAVKSATQNLAGSNMAYVGGVQTSTTPTNERVMSQWSDFAFQKIAEHQNSPLTVAGAVTTSACTTSGNMTFDTDGSGTAAPTYFTISFNNCVIGTTTANGTIALSNLAITYNTATPKAATSISATFTFNFTASNASTSIGMYGGFNIAATGIGSTTRIDGISGTTLNLKVGNKYETLTNFAFTSSYNNTAGFNGYTDAVHYSFASDVILAGFDFTTLSDLVRNNGDIYPRSGQIRILGANLTALRATVVSTDPNVGTGLGTVNLELSQDGGLNYGAPVTRTWTQLALGQ